MPLLSTSMRSRSWLPRDQGGWVLEIREILDETEAAATAVSIYNVAEDVRERKPRAHTPQVIALGPYHHWKPQLYEMEQYKLSAARRVRERLNSRQLDEIADRFHELSAKIRAHYIRYLDFNNETLSWMMVVDACFLLEFLLMRSPGDDEPTAPRNMLHLYGSLGERSSNIDVVRDVIMLENQLPLFLLTEILKLITSPPPDAAATTTTRSSDDLENDGTLEKLLTVFMEDITPFKSVAVFPRIDITTTPRHHLLDVLYHVLVPISLSSDSFKESYVEYLDKSTSPTTGAPSRRGYIGRLAKSMLTVLNVAPLRFVKRVVFSRPLVVVGKLPLNLFRSIFPSFAKVEDDIANRVLGSEEGNPPLLEEILIPSVTKLVAAGVEFRPTDGGLSTIAFDKSTAKFHLPSVTVDRTTEVVLHNLVAYESSATRGPLVLARYTELMNGIIDTEEDVRLLRQRGVVNNRMKSDADVAEMWNGMSKSSRLTRVRYIDEAIRDVNVYYEGKWKVRAKKLLKKYVYRSWKFLAFVAAVLLLVLNFLQVFCSVYSCGDWIDDSLENDE